jgi:hypothetical protein
MKAADSAPGVEQGFLFLRQQAETDALFEMQGAIVRA